MGGNKKEWKAPSLVFIAVLSLGLFFILIFPAVWGLVKATRSAPPVQTGKKNGVSETKDLVVLSETRTNNIGLKGG